MTLLHHDIETVPGQADSVKAAILEKIEEAKATIKVPGNYKKQESIDAYIEAESDKLDASFDERWRKTALNGTLGEIITIGYALDDGEPIAKCRRLEESEGDLLQWFFDVVASKTRGNITAWVGHNCRSFDLRFIYQRAVILGVRPPFDIPHDGGPSDRRVFDTMTAWAGWGNRISLDNLCRALGIPGKSGIDGSMVWDLIQQGEYSAVEAYCADDVARVQRVFHRMNFTGERAA